MAEQLCIHLDDIAAAFELPTMTAPRIHQLIRRGILPHRSGDASGVRLHPDGALSVWFGDLVRAYFVLRFAASGLDASSVWSDLEDHCTPDAHDLIDDEPWRCYVWVKPSSGQAQCRSPEDLDGWHAFQHFEDGWTLSNKLAVRMHGDPVPNLVPHPRRFAI